MERYGQWRDACPPRIRPTHPYAVALQTSVVYVGYWPRGWTFSYPAIFLSHGTWSIFLFWSDFYILPITLVVMLQTRIAIGSTKFGRSLTMWNADAVRYTTRGQNSALMNRYSVVQEVVEFSAIHKNKACKIRYHQDRPIPDYQLCTSSGVLLDFLGLLRKFRVPTNSTSAGRFSNHRTNSTNVARTILEQRARPVYGQ